MGVATPKIFDFTSTERRPSITDFAVTQTYATLRSGRTVFDAEYVMTGTQMTLKAYDLGTLSAQERYAVRRSADLASRLSHTNIADFLLAWVSI